MNNNHIYNQIKDKFIDIKINHKVVDNYVNKYDLSKYYEIGELILIAQGGSNAKYGDSIIANIALRLTKDIGKKYTVRYLQYIRKFTILMKNEATGFAFYETNKNNSLLSWSHYQELLKLQDNDEISYYINKSLTYNLSRNKLRELIKSDEYHRLPKETINKIINKEELSILDEVKDPIRIKIDGIDINNIDERALHKKIVLYMKDFLKQLGDGYAYIDDEYPIKLDSTYNYIDILLFNIKYNCYVVVELKVTELTKDHIGQIQIYMNYIDKHVKNINHNKTIGLIIVKENNDYYLKYSSDPRIKSIKWTIY